MAGYSITITAGSSSVTIDDSALFNFLDRKNVTDQGKVEWIDSEFEIEGDVVDSSPSNVQAAVEDIRNLVVDSTVKASISISLDGTEVWVLDSTTCFGSPHVVEFRTVPAPGNGSSRWRYRLVIAARQRGGQFNGAYELSSSVVTRTERGTVVRKAWSATAKGATMEAALSTVMRFKPGIAEDELDVAEIGKFPQEAKATGLWVWEAKRTSKGIRQYIESTTFTPGGKRYIAHEQGGPDAKPYVFDGRLAPAYARVVGVVVGADKDLKAPKPHWTHDGKTRIRETTKEQQSFPRFDDERRVWLLDYTECWMFPDGKVPTPTHAGHNDEKTIKPPGDGLAGQS